METKYIGLENLTPSFRSLGPSMAITTGHYEIQAPCEVRDIDWNHMDQLHRPAIHKTYLESLRLVTGRSFQLSLTRVGGPWFKFFVLVTDIQLGPGLFYQGFTVFNLLYVHVVVRMMPLLEGGTPKLEGDITLHTIDWYIVSHRLFKFLHGPISRKLYQLNEVQNKDDVPVRIRRAQLRKKGYHFGSDEPDFLNSNVLTDNVSPPKLAGIHRISLKEIVEGGLNRASVGPIELLIRKDPDQGFTVWPAVCPHEGGPMELGKICNGAIICPWHGLRQSGVHLMDGQPPGLLGNLELSLQGGELVVEEAL